MIVVHHLDFSRSTRVIWLMEELGLQYELVIHRRGADFRAPPELKEVHPLGKAPVIEDGAVKIAESGAILRYVNTRYGNGRLAPPPGSDADPVHDAWLQFAESSAATPIMNTFVGQMMGGFPQPFAASVQFSLDKVLGYIEAGVTPGPYLMGEAFTIADIQTFYLLAVVDNMDGLAGYPGIRAYLDRLRARPAHAKAIEIGGPVELPRR